MVYLLGQAPAGPCAVCGLSPCALEAVIGIPQLATCARCALPYVIQSADGVPFKEAQLAVTGAFVGLFQRYYRETGRKLGLPAFMLDVQAELDPETLERTRAMDDWLNEHPHLVAAAAAPMTWPYASVTVEVVEIDGALGWHIKTPPGGLSADPMIPFRPDGLPPGTLVTIQIPLSSGDVREPGPADAEGHA